MATPTVTPTTPRGLVVVTGGSGYIAGYCIAQLLSDGWRGRMTVRNLGRAEEVRATIGKFAANAGAIEFVAADLNSGGGWADAGAGADYVLRVASPVPTVDPKSHWGGRWTDWTGRRPEPFSGALLRRYDVAMLRYRNIARISPRELPTDASLAAHALGFDAIALAGGRPGDGERAAAGGLGVLHGKRQRVRLDPSDLPFAIWRLDNPGGRRYGQAP